MVFISDAKLDGVARRMGHVGSDAVTDRLRGAGKRESSMRKMAYRLDAYGVRIGDSRRTASVGFPLRSFFRFYAQLPHFRARAVEAQD